MPASVKLWHAEKLIRSSESIADRSSGVRSVISVEPSK
jgi:hypothetical protein